MSKFTEYKKLKFYNILIVLIILLSVIVTCVINYIVDPFLVFNVINKNGFNKIKPCLTKQERMTKVPQLKLNKDRVDIIYVGSSKTGWWLDTDYHSKITGKSVYSLTLSSSSPIETIIMANKPITK